MAFAVTKVEAYGIEAEEAVNKRYRQFLTLTITGLNTDIAMDLGSHVSGSLGTLWTAAGGSATGAVALQAIRDIATRASFYSGVGSEQLSALQKLDSTNTAVTKIDSAVSVGGSATESFTVTGLLTTDVILAVTQFVDGSGAAVGILSYGTAGAAAADNALSVVYNADPGANAKIRVAVLKTAAAITPLAGQYTEAVGTKAPNILFASGSAPLVTKITIEWTLTEGHPPVEVYAAA